MNLSTEELKALNRKDESTALSAVPVVTVTEKNWKALLSLVSRLWERQEVTEELLRELMTTEDAEDLLTAIDEGSQEQLSRLQSEIEEFAKQAGNMNESFSRSTNSLVLKSENSISAAQHLAEEKISHIGKAVLRWAVGSSIIPLMLHLMFFVWQMISAGSLPIGR